MAVQFEEVDVRQGNEIITLRVPKGTSNQEIKDFLLKEQLPSVKATTEQRGPLGFIPPSFREAMATELERPRGFGELPSGVRRFAAQAALPTLGTLAGGALGALGGPVAPITIPLLAGAGGLGGELLSEELGISPTNRAAQILSAVAPAAGPLLARGTQLIGRGLSFASKRMPAFRQAQAMIELERVTQRGGAIGAEILNKQKGLMGRRASVLFRAARIAKADLNPADLSRTRGALDLLKREAQDFRSLPEGRQIIRSINQVQADLFERGNITTETLGRVRQLIGASVGRLESQAGVRLGASKKLFSALSDDLDDLGHGTGPASRPATLRMAAGQRAKLEFAVRDFEDIISGAIKAVKGEGNAVAINAKQVLDKLDQLANPKSAGYDKNFVTALKGELPNIRKFFEEVNKIPQPGSPAGPGSIVVRGAGARLGRGIFAGLGAMFGFKTGGLVGGTAGALLGAHLPEMVTAALLTPAGRNAMMKIARLGSGTINDIHWATLSQFLAQTPKLAGPDPESLPIGPLP